tara:strand:- start:1585 stop:1950 length:366 start_codon:yes stop_codon:yes gene_type:complete
MNHSYETIMKILSDLFGKTCAPFQLRNPPCFTVPDYLGQKIYEAYRNGVRYNPRSLDITIDEANFRTPSTMEVRFSIGKCLMYCDVSYRKETASGDATIPSPPSGATDGVTLTLTNVPCQK